MAIQLQDPPSFDEAVAKEFFKDDGGEDHWAALEDQAGLRHRIFEVTGGLALVLAALMTSVALLGNGSHGTTARKVPRAVSAATAQDEANWLAGLRGCPANPSQPLHSFTFAAPSEVLAAHTVYQATVLTTAGTFRIALSQNLAPKTVDSFVFLAEEGYFNCNTFERVVRSGYDLTGDPTGTGYSSPGYTTTAERPPLATDPADQYPVGTVALANTGVFDGGGSQWFVVTGAKGSALSNTYTTFGRVTAGMSVLQAINREGSAKGPPKVTQRVLSVTIQTHTT